MKLLDSPFDIVDFILDSLNLFELIHHHQTIHTQFNAKYIHCVDGPLLFRRLKMPEFSVKFHLIFDRVFGDRSFKLLKCLETNILKFINSFSTLSSHSINIFFILNEHLLESLPFFWNVCILFKYQILQRSWIHKGCIVLHQIIGWELETQIIKEVLFAFEVSELSIQIVYDCLVRQKHLHILDLVNDLVYGIVYSLHLALNMNKLFVKSIHSLQEFGNQLIAQLLFQRIYLLAYLFFGWLEVHENEATIIFIIKFFLNTPVSLIEVIEFLAIVLLGNLCSLDLF